MIKIVNLAAEAKVKNLGKGKRSLGKYYVLERETKSGVFYVP